ncbi:MAG TPA: ferritin-like domain-containing protein [Bacteroidales bacterium]|nr:ferritin-like domain-containing protein [Bacteroidales bacterium]
MNDYHEPADELSELTRDYTRALRSLIEEVEAVMWYQQRVDITKDEQLKKILEHNRDEEIEHACMALEYLRRTMPAWDEELKTYLFTTGEITAIEEGATDGEKGKTEGNEDLGIGNLK